MSTCHLPSTMGLVLLLGCSAPSEPPAAKAAPASAEVRSETLPWAAPPIERAVAVLDGRTGAVVSFEAMLDTLARANAVFLGETHIDETTHRVELEVYEGLLDRRNGAGRPA